MYVMFYCIIDETVQIIKLQWDANKPLWNGNGTVPWNTSEIKSKMIIVVM